MLAGVWFLYFSFGLTTVAMAPLVGPIGAALGLGHSAMGTVLGAWPLVYIVCAAPAGALLDRFGTRPTLVGAALIMGLSGLLRAAAEGHASLFLAVAVFGLGGPLVSVGAPKLISVWFEGRERGTAVGIYMTGPALGGIFALSATNAVMMPAFHGNWRLVLAAYSGVAVLAGLAWLLVSGHPRARAHTRIAGERREGTVTVFLALLRSPVVRMVLAMSIGIFLFNHGLNNWLPEILRARGMDARTAGYWAAIPTAIGVAGSLIVPRLAVPRRRLAILLGLFAAAAGATLLLASATGAALAIGLLLQGVARGAMMPVSVLLLMESPAVGAHRMGAAGGLFFSAAEIGGVLGPITVGVVSDVTGGFDAALHMMTGVCGLLALLLWRLRVAERAAGAGALRQACARSPARR